MTNVEKLSKLLNGTHETYGDYLKGSIVKTILEVSDEKLLNYIHTMLFAAISAEKQQADF